MSLISRVLRWSRKHNAHKWVQRYGGVYADEPGGPRCAHEIWWECENCGTPLSVASREARERAKAADAPLRALAKGYEPAFYVRPGSIPPAPPKASALGRKPSND